MNFAFPYEEDIPKFLKFLNTGIDNYKNSKP